MTGTAHPAAARTATPAARDVFEWDVVTWCRALEPWEAAVGPSLAGRRGLEIGARGGGLALWMAHKGCAEVVCSYYDADMDRARALHRAHGVADRIAYERIDATDIGCGRRFDVVMMKSVLGGIGAGGRVDRQSEAVRQIHGALRPGGLFLFAENVAATPLHRWARHLGRGDTWRYPTVEELAGMLRCFTGLAYMTTGFLALFGLTPWQRSLLGRLDAPLCRLLPPDWRYVMAGAARR